MADRHWEDAALASAVHRALVTLVPGLAAELDTASHRPLARISDGRAEDEGAHAGERGAAPYSPHR